VNEPKTLAAMKLPRIAPPVAGVKGSVSPCPALVIVALIPFMGSGVPPDGGGEEGELKPPSKVSKTMGREVTRVPAWTAGATRATVAKVDNKTAT